MSFQQPFTRAQIEEKIQLAIIVIETKEYKSIHDAAVYFKVSRTTLGYRMAGRKTRTKAHETEQLLSNAEENTLAR
jgi:vacuolar-type H+-ATPase subunit F/Vma7